VILLGSLKVEGIKKRDLDMSRCGVRKLCKEVDFELTSRGKGSGPSGRSRNRRVSLFWQSTEEVGGIQNFFDVKIT